MAITATYLQLQQAIADELGDRQDLMSPLGDSGLSLSPIQNAIQSAIALWEREPFYFNEAYNEGDFTLSPGQEFYGPTTEPVAVTAFENIGKITKVRVLINSNRYTLNARTPQYIEDISVNPAVQSEFPIDFSYFGGQMRFYPIPDQAIPVTLMDNQRLGALVEPTDSNAWTTEAYDLIRSQAKLILAREVLNDDNLVTRMETAIYGMSSAGGSWGRVPSQRGYYYALKAESTRRGGGGTIRPTYFSPCF